MKRLIIVAFLAGCASTPEQAQSLSSLQLCKIMAAPLRGDQEKINAANELKSRGEDCSQYYAYANEQRANMQKSLQLIEMGNAISQPRQVAPNLPPPPMRCTYKKWGEQIIQTCQ